MVYGHYPPPGQRTLGLGPNHRLALGLVHLRFRLDILLNPVQDFKFSRVFNRDIVVGFTKGITSGG